MADEDFLVRIWGARGSLPACSGSASSFGCATPCIEVRCGKRVFVLDAGSGCFPLGQQLVAGESRAFEAENGDRTQDRDNSDSMPATG